MGEEPIRASTYVCTYIYIQRTKNKKCLISQRNRGHTQEEEEEEENNHVKKLFELKTCTDEEDGKMENEV